LPDVAKHELLALVPDADGTAVAAVDGRLPRVVVESEGRTIGKALPVFEREHGIAAPFLRIAKLIQDRDPMLWLLEFEAAAREETHDRLPLERVRDATPRELGAAVDQWLREQREGSRPAERAPWARPGWRAEADAWIRSALPNVRQIAVARQWPLSSVLRVETSVGVVYFKASFMLFRHEPAVTEALARAVPAHMPEVLATDPDRGWMVVRELAGAGEALDRSAWEDAFRALAEVQAAWSGRDAELLALGAQDRRLSALVNELPGMIDDASALRELERRPDALASFAIPTTVAHGDFHAWNAVQVDDRVVIYDWSDACLTHPLFDFATFFQFGGDEARPLLVDAYAEARPELDVRTWRDAWSLAFPLACLHHSISYARIEAALEPDEQDLFDDAPRNWIERALAAL
jgi:hypothetical protein